MFIHQASSIMISFPVRGHSGVARSRGDYLKFPHRHRLSGDGRNMAETWPKHGRRRGCRGEGRRRKAATPAPFGFVSCVVAQRSAQPPQLLGLDHSGPRQTRPRQRQREQPAQSNLRSQTQTQTPVYRLALPPSLPELSLPNFFFASLLTSHLKTRMATLSPIPRRTTGRIERPRTAPPRSGSVGILRSPSSSDCAVESPAGSLKSIPSNISFAPLPEIEPRKRRSNKPLGVAARSSILHRQRANLAKHSYSTTEAEYQYQQQQHPFDTSEDAPQLWPGMDDPQYALQMVMAAGAPEPSNIESPMIVYVENGEPQQSEAQTLVSISTPKRNRSRKGSLPKSPSNSKNPGEWATEEGALSELRKLGTKDKDHNEGSGLKFWKRLAKRNSTPILPIFKLPNDQIPELPTTAAVTTTGNSLVGHGSGKQPGGASPPAIKRGPSEIATDAISPSIFNSPVAVLKPCEADPPLNQSETSTAASSSPPTPEMRIQSVSPIEVSDSYDIVPTPRPLTTNGTQGGGDKDTSLPVVELVETKRHSEEPYSQYERAAVPLMSSSSL